MQAMAKSKGGAGHKPKAKARKSEASDQGGAQLKRGRATEKPVTKKGKHVQPPPAAVLTEDSSDGMGDMDDEFGSDVDLDNGTDNIFDNGVPGVDDGLDHGESSEEGSDDEEDAEVSHLTIQLLALPQVHSILQPCERGALVPLDSRAVLHETMP